MVERQNEELLFNLALETCSVTKGKLNITFQFQAQSAVVVEYFDCISAER